VGKGEAASVPKHRVAWRKVNFCTLLTSVRDGGKWSDSSPSCLYPWGMNPGIQLNVDIADRRLNTAYKISPPVTRSEPTKSNLYSRNLF